MLFSGQLNSVGHYARLRLRAFDVPIRLRSSVYQGTVVDIEITMAMEKLSGLNIELKGVSGLVAV